MPEVEEGVQEEGKPEAEKPAEEPASKPTEQAEDDVVMVDASKKYASRRNPKGVSGADLWAGYGRGLRYDKAQSDNQKLQADNADKDKRIAELQTQVTATDTRLQVDQRFEELNKAMGQKPVADDDAWFDTEEPQPTGSPLTASQIQETVKQTAKDFLTELVPQLKETALGVGQQQREEQQAQAQRQQTVNTLRANELAGLQMEFPDAAESDLRELADLSIQYTGHLASSVDNHNAGDAAAGNEALFDGQDVMKTMVKKRGELTVKQAATTAQKEKDAELEGLGAGILSGEEPEEERKSSYKKRDVEANREKGLSRAHEILERTGLLKNSGV